MQRRLLALALTIALVLPAWLPASAPARGLPDLMTYRAFRLAQAGPLTASFFVGAWTADVEEFGRKTRITWTLWETGRLAYHFQELPDGPQVRGSGGTWQLVGDVMHEWWERADGSSGRGRGKVERIDDNTIRLTIIDNGNPDYRGFVRIYHRHGEPQLSMR